MVALGPLVSKNVAPRFSPTPRPGDHVILPALRIFRARTEGASLDTVPEVAYSQKPSCDGRANKTIAQRGIMGFEPRSARIGYVYNPDRNPNLLDMPAESPDSETCVLWDKEADLLHRTLEDEYYTALQAHLEALSTTVVPPAALKRKYMCGHCGVPKKGHVCPKATPKKRKGSSVRAVVKRARK